MTSDALTGCVRPRRGLGQAARRLAHRDGRIAYLGASVSVQREGFRPLLHAALQREFARDHRPINAAVGAVGSISAVFLMDALALSSQVDLCFVEYTTGDWGGKSRPADIGPAVEGILRKLAARDVEACLLHLWRDGPVMDWEDPVVSEYERVADRYGVPSIHVGKALAHELRSTGRPPASWFRDAVHTTRTGADRTASLILDALRPLFAAPPDLFAHITPLHDNHFEDAHVVLAADGWHDGRPEWPIFRLTYRYVPLGPQTVLDFESSSAVKGLFVVVGPNAARLRVTARGRSTVYEQRDEWTDYERISTVVFDELVPPLAPLRVTRESEGDVKIIGFLATGTAAGVDRLTISQE